MASHTISYAIHPAADLARRKTPWCVSMNCRRTIPTNTPLAVGRGAIRSLIGGIIGCSGAPFAPFPFPCDTVFRRRVRDRSFWPVNGTGPGAEERSPDWS
jgi:hypothetical protein